MSLDPVDSQMHSYSTKKQMIVRFRERWAQLKESMKRKKEAKAAAAAVSSPVREKIVEDAQGEAAEDPPW